MIITRMNNTMLNPSQQDIKTSNSTRFGAYCPNQQHWYCSRIGCAGTVICCEKMTMTGWRNVWSMKLRVQDQGEDQRRPGKVVREDCQACKLNKEDAMDRCKWRKVIKEARWSGLVWVGECFFWYRPTRVVPDQRPLNGRYCCCCTTGCLCHSCRGFCML